MESNLLPLGEHRGSTRQASLSAANFLGAMSSQLEQERFLELCAATDPEQSYGRTSPDRIDLFLPGVYRMFASWVIKGAQPGAHLRFENAETNSTMFRAPHNWGYLDAIEKEGLPKLIAESRRIAGLRGAGCSTSGELPDVYKPLLKALKSMESPPTDLHAGGPRAKVLAGEQPLATALCLCCKERLSHTVTGEEESSMMHLEGLLAQKSAVPYDVLFPAANALPYSTGKKMREADEAESAAVQATRGLLGCRYGSQKCLPYVSKVLERSVRTIEESEGPAQATQFVYELDEMIMDMEFAAAFVAKVKTAAPAIERVLWRGADAKGFPAWWLVRIDSENFGLLGKLGKRWGWHQEDWESALALVPDEHFEKAIEMAYARNGHTDA